MPKPPFIFKRGDTYYYRKRIPTELVRAGCYGDAKDIKRTLGTGDRAKAKSLAMTVALEIDNDFAAKRRECNLAPAGIANCANSTGTKRKLADLSDLERRDFVLRLFIANERRETESGCRLWEANSLVRERKLEGAREDLGAVSGSPHFQEPDWLQITRNALEDEGIAIDGPEDMRLQNLAQALRNACIETAWRTERAIGGHPHESRDEYFKGIRAESPVPLLAKSGKTVGDLCHSYAAHSEDQVEKGQRARSSLPKIKMHCLIVTDYFGAEKPLDTLTVEDAIRLANFLPTLPSNATKRHKGMSLVAAAEREAKAEAKRLIHPETAEDYLTALAAMFSYAVERGFIDKNPFKGKLVKGQLPKSKKRDRQVLTPDEMTRVFSSPEFLAQRQPPPGVPEARFWLPLLCLFHGTRANEIAGMRVADIGDDKGIPFLHLRESKDHRLKTAQSERRLPLHKMLVAFGFLGFVASRRQQEPDGHLFPGLNRNRNGSMADGVCKWWQRFVSGILGPAPDGGPSGARGMHSLRHSWVAAARAAGLGDSVRKRLGGWSQAEAAESYGWANALPMLKQEIDKINFPEVDFSEIFPGAGGQ